MFSSSQELNPCFFSKKKKGKSLLHIEKWILFIYDYLGLSIRYFAYWTGLKSPIISGYNKNIKIIEKDVKDEKWIVIETEKGELVRKMRRGGSGNWITFKFPVEGKDDFLKLKNLYENTRFYFSLENYEEGEKITGDRGYPQFFLPRSPYQSLWIE